jgi:hypothetical protein
MNQAELLRESRSKHLLQSSEAAVKQLRAFKEVLPITTRNSPSSDKSQKTTHSSLKARRSS